MHCGKRSDPRRHSPTADPTFKSIHKETKVLKKSNRGIVVATAIALAACFGATAQTFPAKPVKIVVPYPAGGISDVVTRGVSDGLSKRWGQPVVVDNKPGASAIVGTQIVARAEADGYTLLIGDRSYIINPFSYDKLPYDSANDLVPVANVFTASMVIAVPARSPYHSAADLFKAATANPNKVTYGTFGKGSFVHLDTERILKRANATALHVPYKGNADVNAAVIAGDIDFALLPIGLALPLEKSGKIKVIAYMAAKRHPDLPNAPSAAELNLPESSSWSGLFAPGGTPRAVVEKISRDIQQVLAEPAFVEKFGKPLGLEATYLGPQDFVKYLAEDRKTTETIVQTVNIKRE